LEGAGGRSSCRLLAEACGYVGRSVGDGSELEAWEDESVRWRGWLSGSLITIWVWWLVWVLVNAIHPVVGVAGGTVAGE